MLRIVCALCGLFVVCAWADISFSGSSASGMGGAGLAVMRRPGSQMYQNPAAVAYVRGIRFGMGSFDVSTRGASLSRLFDELEFREGSAVDREQGAAILRKFASEDTRLVVTGDLGLAFNGVAISAGALLDARLLPNSALRNWARTDGNPNNIPANARGDVIALGVVSLPDITVGTRLNYAGGELAVGTRLRALRMYYTHYFADQNALQNNQDALRAPELGNRDYLEKTATGVDVGLLWRSEGDNTSYALVVENLIEPDVRFSATNRDGAPIVLKPFKRSVHAGIATELIDGGLWVLDLVDIGNNTGRAELRTGYEQRLGGITLRTGYASRTGWTLGLGIGGFNIAYSDEFPMVVSRMLNF